MPEYNPNPQNTADADDPHALHKTPSPKQPAAAGHEQPAPAGDATGPDAAVPQGNDEDIKDHPHVRELQRQLDALRDENLRAQAEVQNTRRRAEEEMAKARKFAISGFAENLLSVLDSLEAALNVQNASAEQLREGTEATYRQLLSVLERNAVIEINPAQGDKFDPTQQHAISTVATSGQPAGTVVAVMQKGYLLAERVLRPALVTVAQAE